MLGRRVEGSREGTALRRELCELLRGEERRLDARSRERQDDRRPSYRKRFCCGQPHDRGRVGTQHGAIGAQLDEGSARSRAIVDAELTGPDPQIEHRDRAGLESPHRVAGHRAVERGRSILIEPRRELPAGRHRGVDGEHDLAGGEGLCGVVAHGDAHGEHRALAHEPCLGRRGDDRDAVGLGI